VTLGTTQTISGPKTFQDTTTFGTVNATALQVGGVDISSTYATRTALDQKQNALTVVSSNIPLFSGNTVRTLAAASPIGLSVDNNIISIGADLTTYARLTDLSTKQDALVASVTGTALLNGSVLRSISAGSNVSLTLQNNDVRINVPYITGNAVVVTGATTLTASQVFGGIVNVSGTPPYTITLPSPVTVTGAQFDMTLSVNQVTVTTPVGYIGGVSGGYEASRVLTNATTGQHIRFSSDGANWSMLALAGFTHYGDLNVPAIVSATECQIGGVNINTLFAPRASPTFTGTTTAATITATSVSTTSLSATGGATVQGTLTMNSDVVLNIGSGGYGRVTGPNAAHAIILRGDATSNLANNTYAIAPGGSTAFVEHGGIWRFRQIQDSFNVVRFEIQPTYVNVPTSLQIGGTSTDTLYQQRAWIQAIIPSSTVLGAITVTNQSGAATITSAQRNGTGLYAINWSPSINNLNYLVQGNVRNAAGYVSFNGTTVGGCNILTYNASGAAADIPSGCHVMIFRMP
jgi:hypothetical protein